MSVLVHQNIRQHRRGWIIVAAVMIPLAAMLHAVVGQGETREKDQRVPTETRYRKYSVTGTVTATAGEGGGLFGATVTLRDVETGSRRTAVTDETGQFRFGDVSEGYYAVSAACPGYVGASYSESDDDTGSVIHISDRPISEVSIGLHPGGSIAGVVSDWMRRPLAGLVLAAVARRQSGGQVVFRSIREAITNDNGEYRLHGFA